MQMEISGKKVMAKNSIKMSKYPLVRMKKIGLGRHKVTKILISKKIFERNVVLNNDTLI